MLWRIAAAGGGLCGVGSLLLPYARLESNVEGFGPGAGSYTLLELATLLGEAGNDPTMVYGLLAVVFFGSAVALVAALTFYHLAAAGGVVQAGAAGVYWYGLQLEGSQTFVLGIARVEAVPTTGFYILVAGAAASLLAAGIGAATTDRSGDVSTEAGA